MEVKPDLFPRQHEWVRELRSGRHTQVVCRMLAETGGDSYYFCALGVYIYAMNADDIPKIRGRTRLRAALQGEVPMDLRNAVIDMNDIYGKNFDEIADFIEGWTEK